LPKGFELPLERVAISREGHRVIIEPLTEMGWPEDFSHQIHIPDFEIQPLGEMREIEL